MALAIVVLMQILLKSCLFVFLSVWTTLVKSRYLFSSTVICLVNTPFWELPALPYWYVKGGDQLPQQNRHDID